MMKILKLVLLFFPFFGFAQVIHPNEIRKNIYDFIIEDINKTKKDYPIKVIYLDSEINKFNNIELTTFGIDFIKPIYERDETYCNLFSGVECVEKLAIDNYTVQKVLVNHKDQDYQDFYGIYAPLDSWYNVVSGVIKSAFQNEKVTSADVTIPVKNVYLKNGNQIIETSFYQFKLDKNFKIINNQKIKFSL